jgi:large subunit ribosomal protein L15
MPLHRRLPKRGFTNIFKKQIVVVNVSQLKVFRAGSSVSPEALINRGIIKKVKDGVKILGRGELSKALKVSAHFFSQNARGKINQAGGTVEELK